MTIDRPAAPVTPRAVLTLRTPVGIWGSGNTTTQGVPKVFSWNVYQVTSSDTLPGPPQFWHLLPVGRSRAFPQVTTG